MLDNKYNMSQENNIFFAKRLLVDNIYKSANLEGIAVTFANTNDILNDVNYYQRVLVEQIGIEVTSLIKRASWFPCRASVRL